MYIVLWPPHAKSWLIGKDSDAGRDWGQEEKGRTEDEMAGWHHWLDGHESEWTPGVGDAQGGLACCGSWGRKESDTTERLNWTELIYLMIPNWLIFFYLPHFHLGWMQGNFSHIALSTYKCFLIFSQGFISVPIFSITNSENRKGMTDFYLQYHFWIQPGPIIQLCLIIHANRMVA